MTTPTRTLLADLLNSLEQRRNPDRARSMSAYMKHHFVFYGIGSVERRKLYTLWFENAKTQVFDKRQLILELWEQPEREAHYVAIDLLKKIKNSELLIEDVDFATFLLRNHSWWDSVDPIAVDFVGRYFRKFPEQINPVIEQWCESDNIWLNRSCLIFQLKYRSDVDLHLLKQVITQLVVKKEFFIQKAIGWSLRQVSKSNPNAVSRILDEIPLHGVAKLEATKYLG